MSQTKRIQELRGRLDNILSNPQKSPSPPSGVKNMQRNTSGYVTPPAQNRQNKQAQEHMNDTEIATRVWSRNDLTISVPVTVSPEPRKEQATVSQSIIDAQRASRERSLEARGGEITTADLRARIDQVRAKSQERSMARPEPMSYGGGTPQGNIRPEPKSQPRPQAARPITITNNYPPMQQISPADVTDYQVAQSQQSLESVEQKKVEAELERMERENLEKEHTLATMMHDYTSSQGNEAANILRRSRSKSREPIQDVPLKSETERLKMEIESITKELQTYDNAPLPVPEAKRVSPGVVRPVPSRPLPQVQNMGSPEYVGGRNLSNEKYGKFGVYKRIQELFLDVDDELDQFKSAHAVLESKITELQDGVESSRSRHESGMISAASALASYNESLALALALGQAQMDVSSKQIENVRTLVTNLRSDVEELALTSSGQTALPIVNGGAEAAKLRNENEYLAEETKVLARELADARNELENFKRGGKAALASAKVSDQPAELYMLHQQISDLVSENSSLKSELTLVKNKNEMHLRDLEKFQNDIMVETKGLQDEVSAIGAERDRVLAEMNRLKGGNDTLIIELNTVKEDNKILFTSVRSMENHFNEALRHLDNVLVRDRLMDALSRDLRELNGRLKSGKDLTSLAVERDALRSDKSMIEARKSPPVGTHVRKSFDEEQLALTKAQGEVQKLHEEIASLKNEIATTTHQSIRQNTLNRAGNSASPMEEFNGVHKDTSRRSIGILASYEEKLEDAEQWQAKYQRVIGEKDALQFEMERATAQSKRLEESLLAQISELRAELKQEENARHKAVNKHSDEYRNLERDYNIKVRDLQNELEESVQALDKYRKKMEIDLREMEDRYKDRERALRRDLETKSTVATGARRREQMLEDEIDGLQRKLKQTQENMDNVLESINDSKQLLAEEVRKAVEEFQDEISKLQTELYNSEKERRALEDKLQSGNKVHEEELRALRDQINRDSDMMDTLEQQRGELTEKDHKLELTVAQLSRDLSAERDRREQAVRDLKLVQERASEREEALVKHAQGLEDNLQLARQQAEEAAQMFQGRREKLSNDLKEFSLVNRPSTSRVPESYRNEGFGMGIGQVKSDSLKSRLANSGVKNENGKASARPDVDDRARLVNKLDSMIQSRLKK